MKDDVEWQCYICPDCFDDHSRDNLDRCIKNLKEKINKADTLWMKMEIDLKKSQELNREMLEVISFYGDRENWFNSGNNRMNKIRHNDTELVDSRTFGGKRARQFIAKHKLEIEELNNE